MRTDTTMLVSGAIIAVAAALLLFVGAISSGPAAAIGMVGIGLITASRFRKWS